MRNFWSKHSEKVGAALWIIAVLIPGVSILAATWGK
jgi:hypothetical protein